MTPRWPVVLAIPALLVIALLVDAGSDDRSRAAAPTAAEASTELARLMPTAAGDDALQSTWYCAGGTAEEDGAANQTVIVYNPTDRPTTGTITAIPSEGEARTARAEVPARGQVRVRLTDLVSAPYASAVVEFRGGEVVVEHGVRGPNGSDVGPCASSASDQWHFAAGATTLDASEVLVLFNPFPEAATVDVVLALDGGVRRTPGPLTGLQVPARSVVAAPIPVRLQAQVSATVVARAGRVVADRLQTFSGRGAGNTAEEVEDEPFKAKGLAVTLGVPRTASTWVFPFGAKDDGVHEKFVLYNPGTDEAEVEVAMSLADPARNGEVDPFAVTVNPRSWAVVDLDSEDRIPTRVDHATVVVSRNGVPVVAERVLYSTDPLETSDVAISPGTPLLSDRWIFPVGASVPGERAEWIVASNPGPSRVEVQLGAVVEGQVRALGEDATFVLRPGEHRRIRLTEAISAGQVTIHLFADQPVAAERVLVEPDGARTSTANGIPAGDGEIVLAPRIAG